LEQQWGDLALLLGKKDNGPLDFKLTIEGVNASLNANGFLTSDVEPVISLKASMPRLNLAIIEPLTMGQLKDVKGELSASFEMEGKTSDPEISGRLNIKEADFLATYVNTSFTVANESISFDGTTIRLDQFDILDRKKNKATINGSLLSTTNAGWKLDLSLIANNFQLLNTDEDDNDLFYGNVRINTRATVKGTSILPQIQMNIGLMEGTEVTYVVPQSEAGILDQ